jgi:hypothetical protein
MCRSGQMSTCVRVVQGGAVSFCLKKGGTIMRHAVLNNIKKEHDDRLTIEQNGEDCVRHTVT